MLRISEVVRTEISSLNGKDEVEKGVGIDRMGEAAFNGNALATNSVVECVASEGAERVGNCDEETSCLLGEEDGTAREETVVMEDVGIWKEDIASLLGRTIMTLSEEPKEEVADVFCEDSISGLAVIEFVNGASESETIAWFADDSLFTACLRRLFGWPPLPLSPLVV